MLHYKWHLCFRHPCWNIGCCTLELQWKIFAFCISDFKTHHTFSCKLLSADVAGPFSFTLSVLLFRLCQWWLPSSLCRSPCCFYCQLSCTVARQGTARATGRSWGDHRAMWQMDPETTPSMGTASGLSKVWRNNCFFAQSWWKTIQQPLYVFSSQQQSSHCLKLHLHGHRVHLWLPVCIWRRLLPEPTSSQSKREHFASAYWSQVWQGIWRRSGQTN